MLVLKNQILDDIYESFEELSEERSRVFAYLNKDVPEKVASFGFWANEDEEFVI